MKVGDMVRCRYDFSSGQRREAWWTGVVVEVRADADSALVYRATLPVKFMWMPIKGNYDFEVISESR